MTRTEGRTMTKLEVLQRQGGRIAYEDTGRPGPLVLCVPGMGQLRSLYRFVAPLLSQSGYRVVTVDIRGMGESSARWSDYSESAIASDIVALLQHLQAGPAVIVGNSISAGAAVCVAADHSELVADLVLVGPFVRQVPISRLKLFLFRLALARPWGAATWVNYQGDKLYPANKPADAVAYDNTLRMNLREPGRMRAFQRMAATDHRASEARLDRVRIPSLVVMGTADPDFPDPRSEATLIAERLHGSAAFIEGGGHYPPAESPGEFYQEVLRFLERAPHAA